ncbi:MAG: alpha/beta fold hydrolase [Deltaproteobacteria bacterium]|jgi:pimeloyl-ACP methyl ester carboxylesterase|nr:alpha/beta fold hydrolase [Deltaproteobacteria bacterium]MBW2533135.1 alpha/beta fold hydrolase [Deltaproteobacteria bacterium]
MPEITVDDGVRLHYAERGKGDETVVLSHSYLVDHRHFEPQIEALSERYRVLAYDHRGHGQSDCPRDGYSMERIYADGVAFLEAMDCGPVHWMGLSTGGFVGMRIAYRRPELLQSLVLMDTAAGAEPTLKHLKYRGMFFVLQRFGIEPVLGGAMSALFGKTFLRDPER